MYLIDRPNNFSRYFGVTRKIPLTFPALAEAWMIPGRLVKTPLAIPDQSTLAS